MTKRRRTMVRAPSPEGVPRPYLEKRIDDLIAHEGAGPHSETLADHKKAIAEARQLLKDQDVNTPVTWQGKEPQPPAHPFGTITNPGVPDPDTIQVLAEMLAWYTKTGMKTSFAGVRTRAHMRGFAAIDAVLDTDPSRVHLLTPAAVDGTGGQGDIAFAVENASSLPSSVRLAAHSFWSIARNAWSRAKGPPARFRELEQSFWRTADTLLDELIQPRLLMVGIGRQLVDRLDATLAALHPRLRQSDRQRIAVRLAQLVGLEKAGSGDLAERVRRRRYATRRPKGGK